ncbi:UPF0696 protein C11orf68 homolog [Aplochiton taeniatus]
MEKQDVPGNGQTANTDVFLAENYAAEALAADMDPWVVFDSSCMFRAEFDDWLETNMPSRVARFGDKDGGRGPVGWVCVRGPDSSNTEDFEETEDFDDVKDVKGLRESWEKLLSSGRPVSFQAVKELALNHRVLAGKWLMHLDTGFKVDHAWECVARATMEGKIWTVKVSPYDPSSESRHVICVYNQNFTDENQVMKLEAEIRATGVKCQLAYKPDVYTYLGIYRNNRWKLCPTIYESKLDLQCVPRRSRILNKVTNLEVQ